MIDRDISLKLSTAGCLGVNTENPVFSRMKEGIFPCRIDPPVTLQLTEKSLTCKQISVVCRLIQTYPIPLPSACLPVGRGRGEVADAP